MLPGLGHGILTQLHSIEWFRGIAGNSRTLFKLDVAAMYPSIDKNLLQQALFWAKNIYMEMTKEEEDAIWVSRESILWKGEN